ncbi:MAG: HAD family phosphatase [Ginsengibacter sp.]|jgi:putative hydrolase of the HAD superfamily
MKKIENVILDLGGVLLDIDYNLTRAAFEKLDVENFEEMFSQINADSLFQKLETGHISEEEFFKSLKEKAGLHLSIPQITEAWNAMLLQFRESSLAFLETLSSKYNLYLFSNTNFIHIRAFKEIYNQTTRSHSFDDYFSKTFYSCEIGYRKPNAESYQWILNDLKIQPGTTLFIDDSIQNIEAAESLGMQVVHLIPSKKIEDLDW